MAPTGFQDRSRGRLPQGVPLAGGLLHARTTRSGQPRHVVAGMSPQVPKMARRGTGVGWPGHFAAVMLGGGVGTFSPEAQFFRWLGWPLADS